MLHEVLEWIPFDSLGPDARFQDWCKLKAVTTVFEAAMARNGISAVYRAQAEELVYRALTMTLLLGPNRSIAGLCHCRRVIREMEFLFPFPEVAHLPISEPRPAKLVVERGFIKGFVDLVVEHDNMVYFADWKSDILPSYDSDVITEHVKQHYELQAKLYSLALVKALAIDSEAAYERSFGGLFYVFLRAFSRNVNDLQGVYFERPGWTAILQYEADLKRFESRSGKGRA